MSVSSNEKSREDSVSLDDDSGLDSVDDIQSPADDKERITHLETAVTWIRNEVVSQSQYYILYSQEIIPSHTHYLKRYLNLCESCILIWRSFFVGSSRCCFVLYL